MKNIYDIRAEQKFIFSTTMNQAIFVLKCPTLELVEWINEQIDQNPVLEKDSPEENLSPVYKNTKTEEFFSQDFLPYKQSLYEHLIIQAKQTFNSLDELKIAELIIGNLDENGFFTIDDIEIPDVKVFYKVLNEVKKFDPQGIAAKNLQESLLNQLTYNQKQDNLAYKIIKHHFTDLKTGQLDVLAKKLNISKIDIKLLRKTLSCLNFYPAKSFKKESIEYIYPDIVVKSTSTSFDIFINDELIPDFKIIPTYQELLEKKAVPKDDLCFLKNQIVKGKWLFRILERRKQILRKVCSIIIETQKEFLDNKSYKLKPLTLNHIAEATGLNKSTIARAISEKYLSYDNKIYPLKFFFGQQIEQKSNLSNKTAKAIVLKLIDQENKKKPMSDRELCLKLKELGINCSRRTVNKYRNQLKCSSSLNRKNTFL